ncbi:dynein heavy chain 6, axonemal-like, partial [Plakobranchus ocellatus]
EIVKKAYHLANVYIGTLEKHRVFYKEDLKFDLKSARKRTGVRLRTSEQHPIVFQELLQKFHQQHRMIQAVDDRHPIGVFLIDCREVKKMLKPIPIDCLKEIHRELPVIARDGIDRIMAEVQDGQVRLEYSPVVTQDYVRFLSFLDEFQITPIGPGNASDVFVDVGPIELLTGGEGPIVTSVDSPSEAQLAILQLLNEN